VEGFVVGGGGFTLCTWSGGGLKLK